MDKISFSIILPTRNSAKRIIDQIHSVLNIDYDSFELIVVDSKSDDDTLQQLRSVKDRRVRVLEAENSGVSRARNIGIENAKNDYIVFVDDDDEISNNILSVLNNKIINLDYPDLIRFSGKRELPNGKVDIIKNFVDGEIKRLSKKRLKEALLSPRGKINSYVWLLAIKNDNRIVKFDERLDYLEDEKFYFENLLLNNKTIACIADVLYTYKNNASSKTKQAKNFLQNFIDMMKARNLIIELLPDRDSVLRYDSGLVHLFFLRARYYSGILDCKQIGQMLDTVRGELRMNNIKVPIKYYKNKIEYFTLLDRTGLIFRILK